MALIGSQSTIFRSPGTQLSGRFSTCRGNWESTSQMRSAWVGDVGNHFTQRTAVPDGYRPPYAWVMAISDGGMSSHRQIFGTGEVTSGNLAGGLNGVAPLTGSGDITSADLGLILSAVAAISGSGTLSADIAGKLEATAALAGSGDITAALGALASVVASLTGSGDVTAATTASGDMSSDITSGGDVLTTANVAAAVWAQVCDGDLDAIEALRLILAVSAGNGSGITTNPQWKAQDGTRTRVGGTISGSTRTITTINADE